MPLSLPSSAAVERLFTSAAALEMRIPVTFTNSLLLVTRDISIRYWVFVTLIVTGSYPT